jgi:hypothetical protein
MASGFATTAWTASTDKPSFRVTVLGYAITVTPISRPVVKMQSIFLAAPAANVFDWSLSATVLVPRPFLRLMAASASRIAPDTHRDQASARVRPAPWRHGRPRRTLVPSRIQKSFTELWLPAGRRQSPDGLRCGRSAVTATGDGDPASNSVQLVAAPVTVRGSPDRRRPSGKAARYIERLALL